MKKVRKFFRQIIKLILTKQIGKGIEGDNKLRFEKDILNLLSKYSIYERNTENILSRVNITVDADEMPLINLKVIALKHELYKEEKIK